MQLLAVPGAVHHHEVQLAIPVHVRHRHRGGTESTRAVRDRSLEGSVTIAQEHAHITIIDGEAGTTVRHHDIGFAIPVHVRYCDAVGKEPARTVSHHCFRGSLAVANQHAHIAAAASVISALVRHHDVNVTISSLIRYRQRQGTKAARAVSDLRLEGSVAVA